MAAAIAMAITNCKMMGKYCSGNVVGTPGCPPNFDYNGLGKRVSILRLVEILLNGERQSVPEGQSVTELLESLGIEPSRVALELDRNIVRKEAWATTTLQGGEEVEIVHFVGGG